MKRIFFLLLILVQVGFSSSAEAQKYKFRYYPEANLYYDIKSRQFIYNDNGTWVRGVAVPSSVVRLGEPVILSSNIRDIYYDNHLHRDAYQSGTYDPYWPKSAASLGIPQGYLPSTGECRLWFPDRPYDQQPEIGDCGAIGNNVPAGAWVLERRNRNKLIIEKYSRTKDGMVKEVRHYNLN
ncbi:MAG: hypothetical protein EOO00_00835 [Chitinophagaceae bacterium]|nr:MAG: hypothetical protein EOO00_00835 [Chitinophagaceae bacterium]